MSDQDNSQQANPNDKERPQRLSDSEIESQENNGSAAASSAESGSGQNADDKFKNEYLYLRAEFENFKKQVIKERSDLRKYGWERVAADLLGVLDIFETALASETTPATLANFRKGIEMTASELKGVLQRHGVTEIPSNGQPFDPAFHEALSSEETDAAKPGTITQVFKKAYRLHDRVIRPGQVVVAKAKSAGTGSANNP